MRELGLRAKQKRRFRPRTTDSAHRLPVAENLVVRMPAPDRHNQVGSGDITYTPSPKAGSISPAPSTLAPAVASAGTPMTRSQRLW
ncbi:MAG: hypothetical protein AB7T14_06975 [Candidatus Methylacidiphilaceae bacterium]